MPAAQPKPLERLEDVPDYAIAKQKLDAVNEQLTNLRSAADKLRSTDSPDASREANARKLLAGKPVDSKTHMRDRLSEVNHQISTCEKASRSRKKRSAN